MPLKWFILNLTIREILFKLVVAREEWNGRHRQNRQGRLRGSKVSHQDVMYSTGQQFSTFSSHGICKLITKILQHAKKMYFLPT